MALKAQNLYKSEVLSAKIDAFAKRGLNVQAEAHKIACSVLMHVFRHKNVGIVEQFLKAMPKSMRANGLRRWFEIYGPVTIMQEKAGKETVDIIKFVKDKEPKIAEAIAKPFWKISAKEGAPYEAMDVNAVVNQLIKRIEADAVKTKRDHSSAITKLKLAIVQEAA